MVKRFAEPGISCPTGVARRIVKLAGDEIGDLALEVEKLAPTAAARPPTEADVDLLVAEQMDIKPWNMTDAWGRRDAAGVIDARHRRHREARRRAADLGHLRQPRAPRPPGAAGDGGGRVAEGGAEAAGAALALPGPGAVPAGARVQRAELARAVVRLAQLDEAIKGGSRLDPRLELELALVEISAE